ncbi:MAG: hypothetical protein F6K54_08050 [Okeania sp. SIO3B5]|uniref:hypothetical protein n=1 Tax=Okeania sp. SIO3B5 TaxID=2607811 RepID=UPI0013FF624C|nr:hypothetical protein [Okeania sp. SIO3B5]NEO53038.1 hypothetical protein [Okeania sp. SIO3B5]
MNKKNIYFLDLQQALTITAFIITVICLPLSIGLEFRDNSRWLLYFKLYPHLILFSVLAFGIVLISFNQAINLIIEKKKFIQYLLLSILTSIFLTYIEGTSDNMLLLELNNQAESTINDPPQGTIVQIKKTPEIIVDINEVIRGNKLTIQKSTIEEAIIKFRQQKDTLNQDQKQGYYTLMKKSLSYSTWENHKNFFSISRVFYLLSFLIMTTVSIISCILLVIYSKWEVRNFDKYINLLTLEFVIFMTWIPLRYYYNLNTLNLIFGSSNAIGHFDAFAFLIYPIYLTFLCWKTYENNQDLKRIGLIIATFIILTIIGLFFSQSINDLFGLNSNLTIWIVFWVPSLVYYFSQWLKTTSNLE